MTKHAKVEAWLKKGGHVSGVTALNMFGVYRLSSVIHVLRKEGYNIITVRAGKDNHAIYKMACNDCDSTTTNLLEYEEGVMLCRECARSREHKDVM